MIYLELFLSFLKIGTFTFGGGYAMLPLIQEEVAKHSWLNLSELVDFIAVCESTPGPFAINVATYVGAQTGGIFGAFCSTLGVILPSFIIILIVAKCFQKFKNSFLVKSCMSGLKPAVIGLIGAAALSIATTVFMPMGASLSIFKNEYFYAALLIFIIAVLLVIKKVHPIIIICISAVLGIITGYVFKM